MHVVREALAGVPEQGRFLAPHHQTTQDGRRRKLASRWTRGCAEGTLELGRQCLEDNRRVCRADLKQGGKGGGPERTRRSAGGGPADPKPLLCWACHPRHAALQEGSLVLSPCAFAFQGLRVVSG